MSHKKLIMNSPEFIKKFIAIYKKHVCLWKMNDKTYTNKDLRDAGQRELLDFCKEYNPNATIDTVRSKINNIRCSFRKEIKKVIQSQESGALDESVYVPKLWYYDLLLFTAGNQQEDAANNLFDTIKTEYEEESSDKEMEDGNSISNSISNSSTMLGGNNHSSNRLPSPIKSQTTSYIPNKRKRSDDGDPPAQLSMPEDEFDAIGKLIACKLRRMAESQRDIAEHLLNNLLYYGLKNRLDDLTFICLSETAPNSAPPAVYSQGLN